MVCSTAILSSTLALSLLRHSSPPSKSFVLSPFSLNTALSIVHDGADGITQKELTNLLLNGCSPSDVTDFFSSLALSIPSTNSTGVAFKSANRFYVNNSISLNDDYQKHIEDKYKVKVANINLGNKTNAAKEMNNFIEEATNGMIKDIIEADQISHDTVAFLINAIHFLGKWKYPFNPKSTFTRSFNGVLGKRQVPFMMSDEHDFRVNWDNDFGTALIVPYQDENYNLFYLIPKRTSNLEEMRNELTGQKLLEVLKNATSRSVEIIVPKFKIESELDGKDILMKMGVKRIFEGGDLTKISSTPLEVSKIQHNAVIEMDEQGTTAAAVTVLSFRGCSAGPPTIVIDRPFLFGIMRKDDILFIGQFA